jgi:hypothetical protein
VFVAVGNVRSSATPEIIIGNDMRFRSFSAYTDISQNAPVHVAVKEIDQNDGAILEIVTVQAVPVPANAAAPGSLTRR